MGAVAANKTVETDANVSAFVATVTDPAQRADADTLIAMMSKASGEPPKMWGPSIIGFGTHHYRYESGREGDTLRIGFSPRKGQTVLYALSGAPTYEANLARLGKHKTGKGCLYIKRLADVDMAVLTEMVTAALATTP
jgi:Domain of unknown function (DU1801)